MQVANPVGLAVDAAGNLYYGEITFGPLRVQLMERRPDGTITNLGTVVDTPAGYVSFEGFDLAAPSK